MTIIDVVLIAIALAMDAFAVSICKGLTMKQLKIKNIIIIALYFALFQGGMPLIGYLLGSSFVSFIESFSYVIAFVLLGFIGSKMIYEAITNKDEDENYNDSCKFKDMIFPAIATSIDALAVGISLAVLDNNIFVSSIIIAIVTFVISIIGVLIGKKIGSKFQFGAEVVGGIILITMGLRILLCH